MARVKGSGSMGPVRSVRLPRALDEWLEERLARYRERSPSEVLVALIHGGLRLREGYMAIHRRMLEQHAGSGNGDYAAYTRCLEDTFGREYVRHLESWLAADGVAHPGVAGAEARAKP
jgi:AcrR family transcriptional regulator